MFGIGKAIATLLVISSIVGFFSYRQHTDAVNFMQQVEKGADKQLVTDFLQNKWFVRSFDTNVEYRMSQYNVYFVETNIIPFQSETKGNYNPLVFSNGQLVSQGWRNKDNMDKFINVMDLSKEVQFPATFDQKIINTITDFSKTVKKAATDKDTEVKIKEFYNESKKTVTKEVEEVGDKLKNFLEN